jgi:hypothetical protein
VLAEDSPESTNWDQAKLNFAFEQQARADNIQGVVENAHTQGPRSISQWRKGAVTKRRDFDWNYVFFDKPTAIIQVRIHDRRRRCADLRTQIASIHRLSYRTMLKDKRCVDSAHL